MGSLAEELIQVPTMALHDSTGPQVYNTTRETDIK